MATAIPVNDRNLSADLAAISPDDPRVVRDHAGRRYIAVANSRWGVYVLYWSADTGDSGPNRWYAP